MTLCTPKANALVVLSLRLVAAHRLLAPRQTLLMRRWQQVVGETLGHRRRSISSDSSVRNRTSSFRGPILRADSFEISIVASGMSSSLFGREHSSLMQSKLLLPTSEGGFSLSKCLSPNRYHIIDRSIPLKFVLREPGTSRSDTD